MDTRSWSITSASRRLRRSTGICPSTQKTAFAPIGLITNAPMTIIARPDLPPNTLKELIDYIHANGDKMTFGHAGLGAASQLCGMLFMIAVNKQIQAIPYKGNAPVMNDLMAKQIDMSCDQTTNTTGPIGSKLVKGYAITTKARLASMPDLPTADEAGLRASRWARGMASMRRKARRTRSCRSCRRRCRRRCAIRSRQAVQRHQHRPGDAAGGDPSGSAGQAYQRDRPLGADHQRAGPVRGLIVGVISLQGLFCSKSYFTASLGESSRMNGKMAIAVAAIAIVAHHTPTASPKNP